MKGIFCFYSVIARRGAISVSTSSIFFHTTRNRKEIP